MNNAASKSSTAKQAFYIPFLILDNTSLSSTINYFSDSSTLHELALSTVSGYMQSSVHTGNINSLVQYGRRHLSKIIN